MRKAIRRMKEERGNRFRKAWTPETVEIPKKKDDETERETRLRERAERLIYSASKRKPGVSRVRKLGKLRGVLRHYSIAVETDETLRSPSDEDLKRALLQEKKGI